MEITARLLKEICPKIFIAGTEIDWVLITNQKESTNISIEGDVILFSTTHEDWYTPADEVITLDAKGSGHINVYTDYHEEMIESMQRQLLPIRAYVVTPVTENHVVKYLLGLKN